MYGGFNLTEYFGGGFNGINKTEGVRIEWIVSAPSQDYGGYVLGLLSERQLGYTAVAGEMNWSGWPSCPVGNGSVMPLSHDHCSAHGEYYLQQGTGLGSNVMTSHSMLGMTVNRTLTVKQDASGYLIFTQTRRPDTCSTGTAEQWTWNAGLVSDPATAGGADVFSSLSNANESWLVVKADAWWTGFYAVWSSLTVTYTPKSSTAMSSTASPTPSPACTPQPTTSTFDVAPMTVSLNVSSDGFGVPTIDVNVTQTLMSGAADTSVSIAIAVSSGSSGSGSTLAAPCQATLPTQALFVVSTAGGCVHTAVVKVPVHDTLQQCASRIRCVHCT